MSAVQQCETLKPHIRNRFERVSKNGMRPMMDKIIHETTPYIIRHTAEHMPKSARPVMSAFLQTTPNHQPPLQKGPTRAAQRGDLRSA